MLIQFPSGYYEYFQYLSYDRSRDLLWQRDLRRGINWGWFGCAAMPYAYRSFPC